MNKYIIKCLNWGRPWYIAKVEWDPGRTLIRDSAQKFNTIKEAEKKIDEVIKKYPERKLAGRLSIEIDIYYLFPKGYDTDYIFAISDEWGLSHMADITQEQYLWWKDNWYFFSLLEPASTQKAKDPKIDYSKRFSDYICVKADFFIKELYKQVPVNYR